jgi:perosamine synthetase
VLSTLALHGGQPVRTTLLPYGKQWIDEEDITSVVNVLRSDWLTTGPLVNEFEQDFAKTVAARYAVAVSNGTAALHSAMYALDINPGDEVIVPAMTFASTANCVVFQGGKPVFADVDDQALLIDPDDVERKITSRTKAIIAVDFAGHPCDYNRLRSIADDHDLPLVADGCHALGAIYNGHPIGSLADMTVFSFHPVKHITTGEGGAITTDNVTYNKRLKLFRNHGITTDSHQRESTGSWYYEMVDLGYNYRLTDFQCALGISQLKKLSPWIAKRNSIALFYDNFLKKIDEVTPLSRSSNVTHAYHLYIIKLVLERLNTDRNEIYAALRAEGIGANVHYIPVHLHPYYRKKFQTYEGLCPIAEAVYSRIISLPIFPRMTDADTNDVMNAISKVIGAFSV